MEESSIINERVLNYSKKDIGELFKDFSIPLRGLDEEMIEKNREVYGGNELILSKEDTILYRIRRAFINPFTMILLVLCVVSIISDYILGTTEHSYSQTTAPIIGFMIIISGGVRLFQEIRAKKAADKITKLINIEILVKRNGEVVKVSPEEIVVGDYVFLSAGDRIPADMRFVNTTDLFVSQSAITGESLIIEKSNNSIRGKNTSINDFTSIGFMGTTVISGQGEGVVLAVGQETVYGNFNIERRFQKNSFETSQTSVAMVLLKFMMVLIPLIFIITGITKGDWIKSLLFALSVAIGLTPEMLPMVITTCLAKGSLSMSKKETIVKNINAMQVFGSMDVLCVDKTGTLTNDEFVMEYYMDVLGNEDISVLDFGYLNSLNHTGVTNHIDKALIKCREMPNNIEHFKDLEKNWSKIDEIPFDYNRKFVSVLLKNKENENVLIIKGEISNVTERCKYVRYNNENILIDNTNKGSINEIVDEITEDGIRVIAIAFKKVLDINDEMSYKDEEDLVLLGYIAFFDTPKRSAKEALEKLKALSIKTKILTGDNKEVTKSICKRLNINESKVVSSREISMLTKEELCKKVEEISVFVELSPKDKVDIVLALRENGHVVGFLGDGLNDVPVLSEADVGISVGNGVEAAKEVADVILVKKDLGVLEKGIIEGRKTFLNMTKYIHISASSNFGNILSIILASIFLPFLPMASIQLVILNLFYDIICIVLPWDNVDEELLRKPSNWSGKNLSKFMTFFGPLSSIFDVLTFLFLYFVLCPLLCGGQLFSEITEISIQIKYIAIFQSGWFIESMWTQVLILQTLRTRKVPFIQSAPSIPVIVVTLLGIGGITLMSHLPIASKIGFIGLPSYFYIYLVIIVVCYLFLVFIGKYLYLKKHKSLF